MAIARTKAQRDAGLTITQAKAANAGKSDAQLRAESDASKKGKEALLKSAKPGSTDPSTVAALNAAREAAKRSGKSATEGNLANYNTFASTYAPEAASSSSTGGGGGSSLSFQYIGADGKMKTVNAATEAEAFDLATDIDPKSGLMKVDSVYSPQKSNGITSSSGNARSEESRLGSTITTLSAPGYATPARTTKYIDDYEKSLTSLLAQSERDINASADEQKVNTQGEQAGELGATSAGLARMGGYLGGSASAQGALLKLSAGHRAELASLESKRQSALTAARTAFSEKRFEAAKTKAAEAKWWEEESYNRQQDFFDNQRALLADDRTQTNQERDDARAVIGNIITNTTGQDWDELSPETRAVLEENALKAGYPVDVIKNMMAMPKAEAARIDQLLKDAAKKGAPGSILSAISGATSFSEAAQIAAPYIAASGGGGGSGSDVKIGYIPEALKGPVGQLGTNAVYDSLLGSSVPDWFYPIVQSVTTKDPAALGLAESVSDPDPQGWISRAVWDEFKKQPQVQTFTAQVNKKIIGAQALDFGGYSTSAPVPENIEE